MLPNRLLIWNGGSGASVTKQAVSLIQGFASDGAKIPKSIKGSKKVKERKIKENSD